MKLLKWMKQILNPENDDEVREFFSTQPDIYLYFPAELLVNQEVVPDIDERLRELLNYVFSFSSLGQRYGKKLSLLIIAGSLSSAVSSDFSQTFLRNLKVLLSIFSRCSGSSVEFLIPQQFLLGEGNSVKEFVKTQFFRANVFCYPVNDVNYLSEIFSAARSGLSFTYFLSERVLSDFGYSSENFRNFMLNVYRKFHSVLKEQGISSSYIYLDFDFDCLYQEEDTYMEFINSAFQAYLEFCQNGGLPFVKTFNYFFSDEPPSCFTGDCIFNTLTVAHDGSVYLCAKSVISGRPEFYAGNVFSSLSSECFLSKEENPLVTMLKSPLRKELKRRQKEHETCNIICKNCRFLKDKCRGKCLFFNKNSNTYCKKFFETISSVDRKFLDLIEREGKREKVMRLKTIAGLFSGGESSYGI